MVLPIRLFMNGNLVCTLCRSEALVLKSKFSKKVPTLINDFTIFLIPNTPSFHIVFLEN